ncbi:DUF1360 domain-containing protein [Priestia endophytica]|jgi:Protein of unknown function (DUF1360)|uniref:Sporulation protein n=2 Tax=Priestia endophytica TaxID=135735 RepID=A0A329EQC4_9BACI|nr:DUF1360 domain-containing protein [Priestia endophytica]KAB2496440.1 DUF1360 domain-containing protein [Priestia endophytica]KYG31188.1 sporulation protein [Priestia endophytica]MBG9810895.1 sporulation protein [Priestia endophytica]MBG9813411.1 sporulation protein [Priestia endophytica]MED4073038.1 DUF1360 domain-containing protein [Priestia endophytica]
MTWMTLLLLVLATFRLTRLIVFDKITFFIRRPFHEIVEETLEDGSVTTYIKMKGTGLRRWIGELLSCYWCTGMWCAIGLYALYSIYPDISFPFLFVLAIAGIAGIIESFVE